jgi:PhzF family phenazine biosynthesis protein
MRLQITFIDSFTDKPFSGNPAAVCVLKEVIPDSLMQQIAAEINLSETAFLLAKNGYYHLRWFTPKAEVKLCGHATLASAHALWEQGLESKDQIIFSTLSGELTAIRQGRSIELIFPVEPITQVTFHAGMIEAIGIEPIYTGKTDVRYFAELSSAGEVRNLKPNLVKLLEYPPARLIVTARSDDYKYDFISRYFAPGIGIPEDPVTGSAHCSLALYWAEKLKKTEFLAYQASERGGEIGVILDKQRVRLLGKAITVMQGTFLI